MVIDHVAAVYVPAELLVGQLMRFVGCLTGPCMAFFLAEGYLHTRDLRKYGLRLAIFALLSWPPFSLFQTGRALFPAFGVIYTLFLGYLAILLWDKGRMAKGWKTVCTVLLCLVSMPGDWAVFDVLCPLLLFLNRDRPSRKWKLFALLAVLMMLLAVDWGKPLWTSAYVLGIPLVVILLNRANALCNIELGTLFRPSIMADVISQSIIQLSYFYIRIHGNGRHLLCHRGCCTCHK